MENHSLALNNYVSFFPSRIQPAVLIPPSTHSGGLNPVENSIEALALSLDSCGQSICRYLYFSVPRGSICALVARDQLCKKALLDLLAGRQQADTGSCLIKGADACSLPLEAKNRIGVLHDEDRTYEVMTIGQLAIFFSGCSANWRPETYFRLIDGIGVSRKYKVSNLDRNQRSLVALAVLLARNPDILILDDFFTELDDKTRTIFFTEISAFNVSPRKTTVIVGHHPGLLPHLADTLLFIGRSSVVNIASAELIDTASVQVLHQGTEPVLIDNRRFSVFTLWDQPAVLHADAPARFNGSQTDDASFETLRLSPRPASHHPERPPQEASIH